MSAQRCPAERLAKPSDPLAPRRIRGAADRSGDGGKQPLRYLRRCFGHHSGIEDREPCRVQADIPGKESIPHALAGGPPMTEGLDLTEQAGEADLAGRRAVTLPQARPLERRVEVAWIAYKGLSLSFEECH